MDIGDPVITSGVNLFVNIAIFLIAFVTAISMIDMKKVNEEGKK